MVLSSFFDSNEETYGIDIMVYNIPTFVPISLSSDIWAMHGVVRETNAPAKKPYNAANIMVVATVRATVHMKRQERPAIRAQGNKQLNRPMASDNMAGAIRPRTPSPFMTART